MDDSINQVIDQLVQLRERVSPDETEMLQLRRTIEAQHRELQKLVEQRRGQMAFVQIFCRDLRSLSHQMLGLLGMLQSAELSRVQREAVQSVEQGLDHLLQMASPWQESLGADWSVPREQPFELRALLRQVAAWMARSLEAHHLELEFSVSDSVPQRHLGDPVKLRQVLLQFLENAIRFTRQGRISMEAVGERDVRICVRDQGPGLRPEEVAQLFEDPIDLGEHNAGALGVHLARYLVEKMGGRVSVDSMPGRGTSVTLTLPLKPLDVPTPQTSTSSPPAQALQMLLAEDEPVSQRVTLRALRSMGHRVDIVSNGVQALQALERAPYDVVLLDVDMPEMDGLETARQILQRFHPPPYLIALTANNTAADRRKVMLAGMQDFLSKPLRIEELEDALTQVFP